MKNNFRFVKPLWFMFSFIICFYVNSQKLIESRQSSFYTYIYKLTDKEALNIYKKNIWIVDSSFFHTLADSFPTYSQYKGKLTEGHYLRTFSEKNKQKLSITTVQNFDVFILNNNTDLSIQVYDLEGNIIKDADVTVRSKNLKFNKKTESYLDKKSNQKALLKVTYKGFTTYYNLNRQYDNSLIKRGARKVVYGTPLKYAWMPVNFIIHLPVDGVKSIVKSQPQGTIYRIKNFFVKSFNKVACVFDDYYCGYCSNNRFEQKHTGYIVFNKPKYHPGDTVKFKSFLVTRNGNLIDKPVKVILQTNKNNIELTELNPYRDGCYEYQFMLHDSLQLLLDRSYYISLERNGEKVYIAGTFKYEDYELSKNKLTLRIDKAEHYQNNNLKLFVKGSDENDLNLLDARIEIAVKPNTINSYFANHIFIPDTILFLEKKLDPIEETVISVSDSLFPEANFDYDIFVRLLTSDNESVLESKKVKYFYESNKFDIELLSDSLRFVFNQNGVPVNKKAEISAIDNFGNSTRIFEGNVPCTMAMNPYYASYAIKSDSLWETINISSKSSLLQCFSERTNDSIFIVVDNPRKIPFSYNIYLKNGNKSSGYANDLNIKQKSASQQNYFVSLRYLWGGKIKEDNYRIPLIDKKLNITVTQPRIVYPGQKSRIEILVTDFKGKPVEGVDLTAYSLTKKFNYSSPDLPYLGKIRKNKEVINNFTFKDFKPDIHNGLNLDYASWKLLAGLDSIEYYKFIYPEMEIYRFEYCISDSLTQFAPFVVSKGAIQPVHVIYVDSKPVYFSWSTNNQPYSFKIDSGYHQIKLRTGFKNITIDSLYINNGKKLIFSLNEVLHQNKVKTENVKPELSDYEQRLLYKYIFPYRNTFGEKYAYVEQSNNIQLLSSQSRNQLNNNLAGPIAGNVTFNLLDSFSTNFFHEPFYEYEFAPELLKMRSRDAVKYPKNLNSYQNEKGLNEGVLTKNALIKQWNGYKDTKRYQTARYKYPRSTSQGMGRLLMDFPKKEKKDKDYPLNILLFRYDNHEFLRVYPGNTSLFHELNEGYYKLIFFYTGAKYHIEDSVSVKPNGLNYYEFNPPQIFKKDSFSLYVSDLIEETIFKPVPYYGDEENELKQIYNIYQQQFPYIGDGEFVEGHVVDNQTNEPLPGVNVIVKGTTYGTVTNLDGYYSLKVPANNSILCFNYVGYVPEEKLIGYNNTVNTTMTEDIQRLEEVVVVGYGVQKRSELTGSVVTVSSQSLLRGIPGVSGNISQALKGKVGGIEFSSRSGSSSGGVEIRIRGASSIEFEKTPLYIINGNVYTGNISELDPALIQNIEILKDASATSIYGARGANGVVIIETQAGAFKPALANTFKGADFENTFYEAASQSGSIRDNFSDYAFWQPKLITNKEGKSSFEVTFPDDVTSWETFYLAMNDNKQSGQTKNLIKSYKPLMAQLAVPRFLIQNDTTFAIAKVLNYLPDSIEVTTRFEINQQPLSSNTRYCVNSIIDTLSITATDSVSVKYYLEKQDGYFDGELRDIAVFPLGLEKSKGAFYVLDQDTTFILPSDTTLGDVTLYARADILDVIEDEINHLIKYKYSCNEQIASKLKALLAKKNIALYKEEQYKNDIEVDKLIRLLRKNQIDNGLWGWWKDSEENKWISLHVLEALSNAEKLGYNSKIDKEQLTEKLIWELENSHDFYTTIRILKIFNLMESQINLSSYLSKLEKTRNLSFNALLQILELKQLRNIYCDIDTLKSYQKNTLFGNVCFADESQEPSLLNNDIQNTLFAYKILKADSSDNTEILRKIRNYFFESRKTGYWRNTFESAQIIQTILPDLLSGNKSGLINPSLQLNGDISKTITEFPCEMKINPGQNVTISKFGYYPVYLTSYQRYWDKVPKISKGDFEITTRFDSDKGSILKAGSEITLFADVVVKKDAQYVMINVPIPGGCSYAEKRNNYRNESHREYFKNETAIFCENLSKGNYTFEIKLIPKYTGTYTLNPAKVELMYYPLFNANNEIKKVRIN